MEAVRAFNNELSSVYESKPPISRAKMSGLTKAALKAIKFYKHVVQSVEKFIHKCRPEYKIPGLYVMDSIVRQSRHQFGADRDVFAPRFTKNIVNTFQNLFKCPPEQRTKIVRVLNLWQKNNVFPSEVIQPLMDLVAEPNSADVINRVQKTIEEATGLAPTLPPMAPKKPDPSPAQTAQATTVTEQPNVAQADVLKAVTQLVQQSQQQSMSLSAQQNQLQQLQLLQQQLMHQSQMLQHGSADGQPIIDGQLLAQIQSLTTQLLNRTEEETVQQGKPETPTQPQQPAPAFNSKLLDFDYGESDEEEGEEDGGGNRRHSGGTAPAAPPAPLPGDVQNLLNNPGMMAHIQQVSATLQQTDELNHQMGGAPPQPSQSDMEIEETYHATAQPLMDMDFEKQEQEYDDRQDHIDVYSSRHGRSRHHRRSRSRDRHHRRSRSRERRSRRSRSRDRHRRSRSRDRERTRERREKDRERRKQGLPPLKDRHVAVCSTQLWIGKLQNRMPESEVHNVLQEFGEVVSLAHVPPRGCAFVTMGSRKQAQQALQKLKGTTVLGAGFKISWSQGPAMNEFRDCWDQEDGTTFIPWHRCPADLKPYLNGAMLDEESLPPHMKTNESAAMGDMEQPLESVASALQPPAGPTPTLPQSNDALPPTMGMTNPPALDRGPPALDRGPPPPNAIMPLPPSSVPAQTHTATVPVGMPVPAMPQGMMPLLPGMNLTPGGLVVQGSPAGVVQGGPAGVIQGGPAGVVQGGPAGVVQGGPAGVVQGGPGPFPLAAASPAPTGPPPNMQHLIFPRRLPLMSPSGAPQPATLPLVSGQQPPIFTPMSEAESSQHGLIQLQPLTSGAITVSSPSLIRAGVGNIRSRFPSPLPTTLRTSTHGSFVARLTQPGLLARPLGMNIAGRPALPLPGQQSFNTPPPNVSAAGPSNNILPQPPTSAPNDWNKKIDDEPVFTDKSANNRWTKIGSDNPQGPPPRGGMDAEQDDDMRPGDSPVGFRFRGPPGPGMFNSGPRGGDMNMGRGSPRFPPGRGMRFGPPMRGGMRQPFMGPPGGGPSGGGPPFSMRGGPPGFRGRGFDRRGGWRGGRMGGDHFFGQEDENAMPTAFNRNRFEREEHDENALPTAFGKKGPFEQDDNSALPTPFGKKGHFEQKDENSLPTSFGKRNQFEQEENAVPTSFGKKSWNHREDETALPTTFGKKRFGDEDFDENGLPTSFGNKRYNRRDEHGGGDEGYNKRRRYDEYDDRRDRHNERDGRYDRDNDRRDRRDDRRDRDRKTDRDRWSDDRDKDHKDENLDRDRRERDRRDENKEDRNSKERKDEKNEGEKKRDRVRKSRWTDNTDIVVPSTVSVPGTSGSSSTPQPDANVTLEDGEVRDEDEKETRTKADDSVAQSKANNDVHATDNAEIDAQPSTHQATVESEQKEANSLAKHTELPINATTGDLKQDSTNVCDNPASAQGSASNNPVANAHDVPDAGFQQSSDEPMLLMEKSQQHAEQHDQQPAAGHDESEAQAMVTHHSRSLVEPQHNKVACSDQFDATAGGESAIAGGEPAIAGGESAIAGGESAIAGGEPAIAGGESAIAGGEPVMQEAVDSQPTTSVDNLPCNAGFEGCVSPAARCEPEISSNRISPNNDFLHVSEPEIISNPVEQQCSSVLASDSIAPMNTEASVDTVPSVHPSQSPPVVGNLGKIEDIDTPMQSTHNSAGSTVMDNVDSGTSSLELPSVPDNAVDTGTSASVESISITPVTEGAVDSSCSASDVAATADSSTVHSEADSTTAPN